MNLFSKWLRSIRRSLHFFQEFSFKSPLVVLLPTLIVFVLLIPFIPKIKTIISLYDLLPDHLQSVNDLKKLDSDFNQGRSLTIIVEPRDGTYFSEFDLCTLRTWITQQAFTDPRVKTISSPFELRRSEISQQFLSYPHLIQLNCESPSHIPNSHILDSLVDSPWKNLLTDKSGSILSLDINYNDLALHPRYRAFDPKIVDDIKNSFTNKVLNKTNLNSIFTGSAIYEAHFIEGVKQYSLINLILFIVILILHRFFFGTWKSGIIFSITLIITGGLLYGFIGWSGGSLDVLSNSLLIMTAVATLEDFVFLSCEQLKSVKHYKKIFRRLLAPCFFTSLTTIIGFASLASSELPNIQRFGLWAALSALLEFIVTLIVLPAALHYLPSWQTWVDPKKSFQISKLHFLSHQRLPRFILWPRRPFLKYFLFLVFPLAVVSGLNLNFKDDPKLMFNETHSFRVNLEKMKKIFGWEYTGHLVFDHRISNEMKDAAINEIEKDPTIVKSENYKDVLSFLQGDAPPLTQSLIRRELESSSHLPRYFGDNGFTRSLLYLNQANVSDIKRLQNKLKIICPQKECYLAGSIVTYAEFVDSIIRTLLSSLSLSLILVTLIVLFLSRAQNSPHSLQIVTSIFWGPAALICLLALFQFQMNMITSVCASVVVGLTGDNAIQFLFSRKSNLFKENIENKANGAIITATMMSITSLIFLLAYFRPTQMLGLLLMIGFIICLVGDYWVLKGLIKK